ncbi:MAG: MFS transporter [Promethearchaeota archaeon]
MRKENISRFYIQKRLYTYHFLNDGITFILPTLMASFFVLFELTWFQMGMIFAFNSLTTIIGQFIIGHYTDKDISENLMKLGLFLLALSTLLMIFSFNFTSLLIFAIISGIALAFQHSISYATTSRMYKENRDVMIGRQGASGDVGKCVAVFSSTLILIFLSWKLVLLIWSSIVFIIFIIICLNFRNVKFKDYYIKFNDENKESLKNSNIRVGKLIIGLIFTIFVLHLAIYSLLITNLATYLRVEKTGIISEYSGLILGYTLIFGVIGAYLSGFVKKNYGLTNSILTISVILLLILVYYLILSTSDFMINLFFYALIGFFLFLMYPQLLAAVNDIFHTKKVGFGYGLVLCLGWFGNFIGSLIGGYYADIYSGDVFFIISIIMLIINLVLATIIKLSHKI